MGLPNSAYRAGKINMRFFCFGSAAKVSQRCLKTWPATSRSEEVVHQIAMCYEKGGHPEEAIKRYEPGRFPYGNANSAAR